MPGSDLPDITEGPTAPSLYEQKHGRHHNEERRRLDDLEGGGRLVPADYMLIRSGATYRLNDGFRGVEVGNGPEPGALLQNAITAMGVRAGEVVLAGREDFTWGSIPRVPPGITGRLKIRSTGPIVALSATGPRFLDPADTPAGGTIRRVTLEDLDVDAAGAGTVDITQHLLFGSYRGNLGNQSRINYEDITYRRCRVFGAYSGGGNQHRPIFFTVQHDAAGLPRNTILHILVEDCELEGGLQGISIVGTKFQPAPWEGDPDVFVDDVWVRGGHHIIPGAPQAFAASSHVHIGSGAQVGTVGVDRFYGYGSRDVGVEINNAQDATVNDSTMEDVFGHYFYTTNFRPLLRPNEAVSRNVNCTARSKGGMKSDPFSSSYVCARTQSASAPPLGRFMCAGFNGNSRRPDLRTDGSLSGEALRLEGRFLGGAEIENFAFLHEGIDHANATATDYTAAEVMVTNDTRVDIDGLKLRTVGTRQAGAGTLTDFLLKVRRGQVVVNWKKLDLSSDIANMTDFNLRLLDLGMEAGSSIKGEIELTGRSANIASPRGVTIGGSANMAIPHLKLAYDLAGLSGGADVLFASDGSNKENVEFVKAIRRLGKPAPVAIAVGASPFTWRNLQSVPCNVAIRAGTVSEIAYSRDGANFTVVGVTTNMVVPVEVGDFLRITYSAVPTVIAILVR